MMSAQAPKIGRMFDQRKEYWRSRGLSVRAAGVLAGAGCDTVEAVARLGRPYFERRPNCANRTLAELEKLAAWPPRRQTVVDAIAAALSLTITDPEEAKEAAEDTVIALRRSGFVISVGSGR